MCFFMFSPSLCEPCVIYVWSTKSVVSVGSTCRAFSCANAVWGRKKNESAGFVISILKKQLWKRKTICLILDKIGHQPTESGMFNPKKLRVKSFRVRQTATIHFKTSLYLHYSKHLACPKQLPTFKMEDIRINNKIRSFFPGRWKL